MLYYNKDLENGDLLKGNLKLKIDKEKYPKKYPVENPNFSDYGMEFSFIVKSLVIDGKTVERPFVDIPELETEINYNQLKLEKLKAKKAPFFKLETVDK